REDAESDRRSKKARKGEKGDANSKTGATDEEAEERRSLTSVVEDAGWDSETDIGRFAVMIDKSLDAILGSRADYSLIVDNIAAPGNTTEEREQLPFRLSEMATVAQVYGISAGFQQLVGKVEDVLQNGLDDNGKRPARTNVNEKAQETRFNYDLYNLDFDGGL